MRLHISGVGQATGVVGVESRFTTQTLAMSASSLELLSSRLERLQTEHENRLLTEQSDTLKAIDISRLSTVGTAFGEVKRSSQRALQDYCFTVRNEVLSFAESAPSVLSSESISSLVDCASGRLDANIYLRHFDMFGQSVVRHFGLAGQTVDLESLRLDFSRALLDSGTYNAISSFKAALKNDLEIMRHRQLAAAETKKQQESKLVPAWMGKLGFWLLIPGLVLTAAQTYRAFVPPPSSDQATSNVAPVGSAASATAPATAAPVYMHAQPTAKIGAIAASQPSPQPGK